MALSILQRIAGGDPHAVRDCINQYGTLVWHLARRSSRTPSDAEDATQEIFLQIWCQASRFDNSLGSEKTFIAMIARRRLIDRLREIATEPLMDSSVEVLESVAWTDPGNTLETCQEAEQAMRALEELRPEHRQVLELGFLHGLTHPEIANRLDLPLGTVKSFMRRGLMRIRECLNGDMRPAAAPKPRRSRSSAPDECSINPDRFHRPAFAVRERLGGTLGAHGVAHFQFQAGRPFGLAVDEIAHVEHDPIGSAMPCVVKPSHGAREYRV